MKLGGQSGNGHHQDGVCGYFLWCDGIVMSLELTCRSNDISRPLGPTCHTGGTTLTDMADRVL